MKYVLIVAFAIFMVGCSGVNPKSLYEPSVSKYIDLQATITKENKYKKDEVFMRSEIKAGKYISIKESKDGIYFLGPKNCISRYLVDSKSYEFYDGGLFVPKDVKNKITTFVIMGGLDESKVGYEAASVANQGKYTPSGAVGGAVAGALMQAAVRAEAGRFVIWSPFDKGQFDFLEKEIKMEPK